MSKFNNAAKTLGPPRPASGPSASLVDAPSPFARPVAQPPLANPSAGLFKPTGAVVVASKDSFLVTVGFGLLCALLLSGYLNDWSFRLLGAKAYLSTVCIVLVPAFWCISGHMLAPLKDRVGMWWLAFLLILGIGLPFSIWKSDSLFSFQHYITRSLLFFFYVVTFATNLRRVRTLVYVNIISGFVALVTCLIWGSSGADSDTRFRVPDSMFLSNSNELAMQLLLGVASFFFLFYTGAFWKKALGGIGIFASVLYLLKTGSRGCLLSALVLLIFMFFFTKQKLRFAFVAIPLIAISILAMPASSLHRFQLMFEPDKGEAIQYGDMGTVGSTIERKELLRKSIQFTMEHPLFGLGINEFPVAYTGEAEKQGRFAPWLGTHNSYTQISSECGIPAFICYLAVIIFTFRRSLGIYKKTLNKPEFRELNGLAYSIFCGILVYALATFFFHMAYSPQLPILSGLAVSLHWAAQPLLGKSPKSSLVSST